MPTDEESDTLDTSIGALNLIEDARYLCQV